MHRKRPWKRISSIFILIALIVGLVPGIVQAVEPSLSSGHQTGAAIEPESGLDASNRSDESDGGDLPNRPPAQGFFNCALGVSPLVFHADDPLPDSAIRPGPSANLAHLDPPMYDVSYPAPDGRNEEVSASDTLVVYLYLRNATNVSTEDPCASGGPTNVTVNDVTIEKVPGLTLGDMMPAMTWPDPTQPGLLLPGEEAYGLFSFNPDVTDTSFLVYADVGYSCEAAYCSDGPYEKSIFYPSPDLRTWDGSAAGPRYEDIYGRDPEIRVIGPKASITFIEPAPGTIANPYEDVQYVVELTSLDSADDAITRITDDPESPFVQCRDDRFTIDPNPGSDGWYADPDGLQKVDSADLAGPNGPPVGALDDGEQLWCIFTIEMDPAIINNPADSSFTLRGGLVAYNVFGQNVEIPIEAPSVVIAEASISVTKTIINPPVADGVEVGSDVTYQIIVTNSGLVPLENITLIDSLMGPLAVPGGLVLAADEEFLLNVNYPVGLGDSSPLVNTVTAEAHPTGTPPSFTVDDSGAASILIRGTELTVQLVPFEVDGNPYDPTTNPARPNSVVTFQVEYCNNSTDIFRDLQYVVGYPTLIDGPRPTYVDGNLLDGNFGPGCYQTPGTEFDYTVPGVTDPDFTDPVINSIRASIIGPLGARKYAEDTLQLNIVSDDVEISAYRYSIETGAPIGDDTAALRGETIYYHLDIDNKSNQDLCNVEVRQYFRNTLGDVVPGNPFVIPDDYIVWNSGIVGRLNSDGNPGEDATSADTGNLRVTYVVGGDTPDPFVRIFEVYAPQECGQPPFAEPYLDRAAVTTDISDVQVNGVISVFAASDPDETPLPFGFRQPGLQYKFNLSATNVGVTFTITGLQYCVVEVSGACANQNFPVDGNDFWAPGDDTYLPFETRTDQSDVLVSPSGLTGNEPTPLQIIVTLRGIEGSKNVVVRMLHSFPLLTDELPGSIIDGDSVLVRGDTPVPYTYQFTNQTEGRLIDVRVLNLLETGPEEEGVYETVGVPGFPPDVAYEVCQVHGEMLDGTGITGVCNLTYHNGVPSGRFQMQVLIVGTRSDTGDRVIGLGFWAVEEIEHLTVSKTGPGLVAVNEDVVWSIGVFNNSNYQPVLFQDPDGLTDVVDPDPPAGSLVPNPFTLANFTGFNDLGAGVYELPIQTQATGTLTMMAPPGGFGPGSAFTNTATFVGTTVPAEGPSRTVSGTANTEVSFACPLELSGVFIPNPDTWDDTDFLITVGETKRVWLTYWNIGTSDLMIGNVTDALFLRENGIDLDPFGVDGDPTNDVIWPDPANPGLVQPGEFFSYETRVIIRPIDFPNPIDQDTFSWLAQIELAPPAPTGCESFSVTWFFEIWNPVGIEKSVRNGSDLILPGDTVLYSINMYNRSEPTAMFIQQLDDSLLTTSPLLLQFPSGTATAGRLEPTEEADMVENGVQDGYVVGIDDPDSLENIATVTFYVPSDSGPPEMEKGPDYPMSNVDEASVGTSNPLVLTLLPSSFEAPAGSTIDIDVTVTNFSSVFTIGDIEITTGDTELSAGMAAAGYAPPILLLPTSARSYLVTGDHYQIPPDYTDPTLTICATAHGFLIDLAIELPPVEACVTITILEPELEVTKEAFEDDFCTIQLPDTDGNGIGEINVGSNVYYGITFTNNSTTLTFGNIAITDITNDGDDLSVDVQTAFEAANGGSTDLLPGAEVSVCIPKFVTQASQDNPVLINTITVEADVDATTLTVESEVTVDVFDANVGISKVSDRIVAFPGSVIQYSLVIINRNTDGKVLILDDVWDSLVTGQLPGASYHDTCTLDGTASFDFANCDPTVTSIRFDDPGWQWPLPAYPGYIPAGETATFTYEYEVQSTDPDPLINEAGVYSYLYEPPPDLDIGPWDPVLDVDDVHIQPTDLTQALVAITNSQLLVRKEARPTVALVGTQVTYDISITNIGDRPVSGLQVVDCNALTPCNFGVDPFEPGFGGLDLTTQIAPVGAQSQLNPFDTAIITNYEVTMPTQSDVLVNPDLDPFINTVFAQGEVSVGGGVLEPTLPGSDTAIVDLIVPGIQITKSASVGSAAPGELVEYTIQVFNTGDAPLRLDSVVDIVPGDSAWTPLTTMNFNSCDEAAPDFAIGPTSSDRLQPSDGQNPGDFVCATVQVIVGFPQGGGGEFVNTVRVFATGDPDTAPFDLVDSASAEIDIRTLDLAVTKLAYCIPDGAECTTPSIITTVEDGQEYEYRVTIVNGSPTAMTELRISDPDFAGGALQVITDFTGIGNNDALFDPDEEYVFSYNHIASIADDTDGVNFSYTNYVTVVAVEDGTEDLTPPRIASYTVVITPASLEATKFGCVGDELTPPDFGTCVTDTPLAQPGDYVWYQVTIVNPSAVLVDNIAVTDSLEGVLDNVENSGQSVIWPAAVGSLPACEPPLYNPPDNCPTAIFTYRSANPVSAADSSILNTAIVTGQAGSAQISVSASETIYVAFGDLVVTIVEDNGITQAQTGTVLNFTITVQNLGTDDIENIEVLLPLINGATPLGPAFTLTGGGMQAFNETYTVTSSDSVMDFEVIANGLVLGVTPATDTDVWTVVRIVPGISISKVADTGVASPGDTVTYTVTIQNTGTANITELVVSDSMLTFPDPWPTTLTPGQTVVQQQTYMVTGAEGSPIINTVTVSGLIAGTEFVVTDTAEVFVPNGDLLVTNTPSILSGVVGDTVSFTYEICNLSTGTSPVDDLTNVSLTDDDGPLTLPDTTLVPGQCFTVVRDVVLTDLDVPELSRTVVGQGDTSAGGTLTQTVTRTVTVIPAGAGDLRLSATPSASIVSPGDTLDVDFVVSNVGDVPLTITDLTDVNGIFTGYAPDPIGRTVLPGRAILFAGDPTFSVDGTVDPIADTWTVTAEDASATSYSHSDNISVPVVNPGATLVLEYTADMAMVPPGGTVTYTYTVTNISVTPVTARLEAIGATCTTYTPGGEALWDALGTTIDPGLQATATATCFVAFDFIPSTVDHTIQVFDVATPDTPQDTIDISTPLDRTLPLEIEIVDSDPLVWRVDDSVVIRHRIGNISPTSTLTDVTPTILEPTPCIDLAYFDDLGNPVAFDGTLAPMSEIYVHCTYMVLTIDYPLTTVTVQVDANEGTTPMQLIVSRDFTVINLGLTLTLTGLPDNDAGMGSIVNDGETVSFTLTLENTGETAMILPPETEAPVTSQIYDASDATVVVGNLGDLWTYLNDNCTWPLLPGEQCIVSATDVTDGGLSYTAQVGHPSNMVATVQLELWGEGSETPIFQNDSWNVTIRRPSLIITSITVSPNPGNVGDPVTITATILNDGFFAVNNVRAVIALEEIGTTAFAPQNGIVLTSGRPQTGPFITLDMTVTDTTLAAGAQTTATVTWDVDRAATILGTMTASAETTVGGDVVVIQSVLATTFSTGTPDGNLDPNALDPILTKTVSPTSAFPDEQMIFTITIRNGSTSIMDNVAMVDAVPDAFQVLSASSTAGASIVEGQLVTVTTGSLGPGDEVIVTITVVVGSDVSVPSLWVNVACAAATGRGEVCTEVEIPIGVAEGALPTTGFGALPADETTDDTPVSQGFSGASGILPMLMLGMLLLFSTSMFNRNRRMWIGAGVALATVVVIGGAVLLLGGDDETPSDKGPDEEADVPGLAATLTATALARREGFTPGPGETEAFTPEAPSTLPFAPTLRPSPTPYILPTAAGPRRLEVPRLGYSRPIPIVELPYTDGTWDVSTLGHNVGWLELTTWLEPDWGNTVLVGHVQLDDEDPGPFYRLGDLQIGDEVVVMEGDVEYRFQVTDIETVSSTAIEVTHPTREPVLTLVTCTNWDFAQGVFADRLIIRAEPLVLQ